MTSKDNFKSRNSRTSIFATLLALSLIALLALSLSNNVRATVQESQVAEGAPAPDFSLPSDDGRTVKLSDFKGKKAVVLYFYPKDETPGCTKQACAFRDSISDYKKANIEVLGVSVDSVDSHKKFKENQKLNFTLLADENKEVSKKYGVLSERGFSKRVTFFIDKNGVVRKIYNNVDPALNAKEVLDFAKTISAD